VAGRAATELVSIEKDSAAQERHTAKKRINQNLHQASAAALATEQRAQLIIKTKLYEAKNK
jgi:hypothetical protein